MPIPDIITAFGIKQAPSNFVNQLTLKILVLLCGIAKMDSSVQFLPVNQNTGSIAKSAINPAFLLILAFLCYIAEMDSVTQLSPINQNAASIA
ncbi:hypothetical protein [Pediococcus acidilactici]|uniref:hypothetical protein n=1 Tax=Pediococcus acidilactici TaxID=1254 RepID=UPI001F4F9ACD|nr:hypothetical protein [Pediococcus acidilactici]